MNSFVFFGAWQGILVTGSTVLGCTVVPKLGKRELWLFSITKGSCETRTHFWGRGVMNKAGRLKAGYDPRKRRGKRFYCAGLGVLGHS